jgi:hypothetical protein
LLLPYFYFLCANMAAGCQPGQWGEDLGGSTNKILLTWPLTCATTLLPWLLAKRNPQHRFGLELRPLCRGGSRQKIIELEPVVGPEAPEAVRRGAGESLKYTMAQAQRTAEIKKFN